MSVDTMRERRWHTVDFDANGRLHHVDGTDHEEGGSFRSHTYVPAPKQILEGWKDPAPPTELSVVVESIKLTSAVTLSYIAFERFASARYCSYDENRQRLDVACESPEVAVYLSSVFETMAREADWRGWTVHRARENAAALAELVKGEG